MQALSATKSPVLVILVRWADRHQVHCRKAKSESQRASPSVVVARNGNSIEQPAAAISINHVSWDTIPITTKLLWIIFYLLNLFPIFCWMIESFFFASNYELFDFYLLWINFIFLVWLNWILVKAIVFIIWYFFYFSSCAKALSLRFYIRSRTEMNIGNVEH